MATYHIFINPFTALSCPVLLERALLLWRTQYTARSHHNQIGTVTSQNLFVLSHFSLFKGPTLSEMAQLRHFEKYCILANQPNNMSSVAHSHIWCNIAFPRIAHLALARNVVQFNDTLYLICFLNRKLAPPVWKYKSTKIPYVAKIHSVMQKTSGPWPMTSQWGTLKKGRGMKF